MSRKKSHINSDRNPESKPGPCKTPYPMGLTWGYADNFRSAVSSIEFPLLPPEISGSRRRPLAGKPELIKCGVKLLGDAFRGEAHFL